MINCSSISSLRSTLHILHPNSVLFGIVMVLHLILVCSHSFAKKKTSPAANDTPTPSRLARLRATLAKHSVSVVFYTFLFATYAANLAVKRFHDVGAAAAAYAVITYVGVVNPVIYTFLFPLMAVGGNGKMAGKLKEVTEGVWRWRRGSNRVEPVT